MGTAMMYTSFNEIPQFTRSGHYEIDVTPESLIRNVDEFVRDFGLQLNPDFQRGHVWTERQQQAYIEFFLRGGRTARVIYFNYPSWHNRQKTPYNDFVIVDGKQRLQAWRKFIGNELKVFGSYIKEYTDSLRITRTMKIHMNDLPTRAEVLQWYLDFNSGGVVHTEEELAKVRDLLQKE